MVTDDANIKAKNEKRKIERTMRLHSLPLSTSKCLSTTCLASIYFRIGIVTHVLESLPHFLLLAVCP